MCQQQSHLSGPRARTHEPLAGQEVSLQSSTVSWNGYQSPKETCAGRAERLPCMQKVLGSVTNTAPLPTLKRRHVTRAYQGLLAKVHTISLWRGAPIAKLPSLHFMRLLLGLRMPWLYSSAQTSANLLEEGLLRQFHISAPERWTEPWFSVYIHSGPDPLQQDRWAFTWKELLNTSSKGS